MIFKSKELNKPNVNSLKLLLILNRNEKKQMVHIYTCK